MIELAGIIVLGILAQWLAWKIKIPAILPLILIGLLVGPLATLITDDHTKLIEPIYNAEIRKGLFPEGYLFYFVSLAIGIILFEGGLTLRQREIKNMGSAILRLILLGALITFIGAGFAARFIMQIPWAISFLFAGLIIVTGPTVIAPILQNVPLNRNIATVLKWEGILIDPIGALVAVLVFEFIRSAEGGVDFTAHAFISFFQIILIGFALGLIAAHALYQIIKNELVPHYLLNVFTLAFVLSVFVFSDILAHESGLLSVVIMGMVLGNLNVPKLEEILSFKESLSVLLISILFILLAANINMEDLELVLTDWRSFALFGFVALILRPLSVFASTYKSDLGFNEKLFISWVGPRGIVAAGIASLFGLTLTTNGVEGAEYITPLVFMIVLGTVILNSTTVRPVAKLLGVIQEASNGILIIGANFASRIIGKYLKDQGRHVVLIDNNKHNIDKAHELDLEAFATNIYTDDLTDHFELSDMGYLIAMTSNGSVNNYAVDKFKNIFGEMGTYRVMAPDEMGMDKSQLTKEQLLSVHDDYINISEVARDYPYFHELEVNGLEQMQYYKKAIDRQRESVAFFLKDSNGILTILTQDISEQQVTSGSKLVYLGKKLITEQVAELNEN